MDRGASWDSAWGRLQAEAAPGDDSSGFYISQRPFFGHHLCLLALEKPGSGGAAYSVTRPNTGLSYFDMERAELLQKYRRSSRPEEDVRELWEEAFQRSLGACMHGHYCQTLDCSAGRRLSQVTVLSGTVVRIWGVLESVLEKHGAVLPKADRAMRIVRVSIQEPGQEGGLERVVGVRYPRALLGAAREALAQLEAQQEQAKTLQQLLRTQGLQAVQLYLAQQQMADQADGARALASAWGALTGAKALAGAAAAAADDGEAAQLLRGKVRVEPPTAVNPNSLRRFTTKPKDIKDFFAPRAAASKGSKDSSPSTSTVPPSGPLGARTAQRPASGLAKVRP